MTENLWPSLPDIDAGEVDLESLTGETCGECTYNGVAYNPATGLIACAACGDVRVGETGEMLREAHQRLRRAEAMLARVLHEAWFVLSGGDDPHDRCTECGCAGYGMLRDALHDAHRLLGTPIPGPKARLDR